MIFHIFRKSAVTSWVNIRTVRILVFVHFMAPYNRNINVDLYMLIDYCRFSKNMKITIEHIDCHKNISILILGIPEKKNTFSWKL